MSSGCPGWPGVGSHGDIRGGQEFVGGCDPDIGDSSAGG
jgi:hypothetical protein